jgi:hypothetical protein
MNSIEVKAEIAAYLRFVRQYDLIAFEAFNQDILAVDGRRRLMWVEVKVSIADLLNDRKKPLHQSMRHRRGLPPYSTVRGLARAGALAYTGQWHLAPARFFFAVPSDIADKAHKKILELYPWAGLLSVTPSRGPWLGHLVICMRKAEHIHDRKLQTKSLVNLVRCQSASLANIYAKFARLKKGAPNGCQATHPRDRADIEAETLGQEPANQTRC